MQLYQDPVTKKVKINNFGGFQRDVNRANAGFTLDGDGQAGIYIDRCLFKYVGMTLLSLECFIYLGFLVRVPLSFPTFVSGMPSLPDISTCQV